MRCASGESCPMTPPALSLSATSSAPKLTKLEALVEAADALTANLTAEPFVTITMRDQHRLDTLRAELVKYDAAKAELEKVR